MLRLHAAIFWPGLNIFEEFSMPLEDGPEQDGVNYNDQEEEPYIEPRDPD